jgi:drug/metabolite transporter (DMT)-like permease
MFQPRSQNPALAAAFITCAGAFIALTTLIAKALGSGQFGDTLHPLQISQGRFVFAFVALSMAAAVLRPKFEKIHWGLHVLRTSTGWVGVSLMFAVVAYIPLADATAITFVNPVFAMILAIPLLSEKVGPIRWIAAGIAIIGAMILLRPTPATFQPAALLAVGAALAFGFEVIIIKKLSNLESPFQLLIVNNLVGMVISTLAVLPFWQVPTVEQWMLLAALGTAMACAQACFVNGMARADASFVAPFSYATLIFAALYDALFYKAFPDLITYIGAAIIVGGAVLLALREARNARVRTPR